MVLEVRMAIALEEGVSDGEEVWKVVEMFCFLLLVPVPLMWALWKLGSIDVSSNITGHLGFVHFSVCMIYLNIIFKKFILKNKGQREMESIGLEFT